MFKKIVAAVMAALIVSLVLVGCAAFSKGDIDAVSKSVLQKADDAMGIDAKSTDKPEKTPEATQDESSEPTETTEPSKTAEPSAEPVNDSLVYTDSRFGFSIEFPKSWEGKYRVEQFEGGITVYFVPKTPIEDGYGRFFSLVVNPAEDEESFLDNAQWIHTNKADYVYGGPTDVTYMDTDPEYDTFVRMHEDIDGIMKTLKD